MNADEELACSAPAVFIGGFVFYFCAVVFALTVNFAEPCAEREANVASAPATYSPGGSLTVTRYL